MAGEAVVITESEAPGKIVGTLPTARPNDDTQDMLRVVADGANANGSAEPPLNVPEVESDTPNASVSDTVSDQKMAEIIRAVVEQEQRYRNLEYVVRQESYYRSDHPSGEQSVVAGTGFQPNRPEPPAAMEPVPRIVETSRLLHRARRV